MEQFLLSSRDWNLNVKKVSPLKEKNKFLVTRQVSKFRTLCFVQSSEWYKYWDPWQMLYYFCFARFYKQNQSTKLKRVQIIGDNPYHKLIITVVKLGHKDKLHHIKTNLRPYLMGPQDVKQWLMQIKALLQPCSLMIKIYIYILKTCDENRQILERIFTQTPTCLLEVETLKLCDQCYTLILRGLWYICLRVLIKSLHLSSETFLKKSREQKNAQRMD